MYNNIVYIIIIIVPTTGSSISRSGSDHRIYIYIYSIIPTHNTYIRTINRLWTAVGLFIATKGKTEERKKLPFFAVSVLFVCAVRIFYFYFFQTTHAKKKINIKCVPVNHLIVFRYLYMCVLYILYVYTQYGRSGIAHIVYIPQYILIYFRYTRP